MPADPNRILIVEDDAGLTELLRESLQRAGLQVDAVGNGQECLSWLAAMQGTDRRGAVPVIDRAFAAGLTPARVLAEVLDPALAQIGRAWERQSIPMVAEVGGEGTAENAAGVDALLCRLQAEAVEGLAR